MGNYLHIWLFCSLALLLIVAKLRTINLLAGMFIDRHDPVDALEQGFRLFTGQRALGFGMMYSVCALWGFTIVARVFEFALLLAGAMSSYPPPDMPLALMCALGLILSLYFLEGPGLFFVIPRVVRDTCKGSLDDRYDIARKFDDVRFSDSAYGIDEYIYHLLHKIAVQGDNEERLNELCKSLKVRKH